MVLQNKIKNLNAHIKKQKNDINNLTADVIKWKKEAINNYDLIRHKKEKLNFLTGLPNLEVFMLNLVKVDAKKITTMSLENHLLVVLMKICLGISNKDLGYRFLVSAEIISKIYRNWLPILSKHLRNYIIWPSKQALRENLHCFKNYKNCVSITDCTEIYIQRPLNLEARAITWVQLQTHKHY